MAASSSDDLKRYNLVLPKELFNEVKKIADRRHMPIVALLRAFIKLGLLAIQIEETPGAALLIREGDTEQRIMLV